MNRHLLLLTLCQGLFLTNNVSFFDVPVESNKARTLKVYVTADPES
jgi:hypothetical protein